jgi:glycosyltransferase involved in cell wall biosynthesis
MKLSVLMPVYNEAATVEEAVLRLHDLDVEIEIICVDDASTDGTRAILEQLLSAGTINDLIVQPKNRGKGFAVRTAIQRATGDMLVVQDADLEYDPRDLPRLMAPIVDGRADAVLGSRFRGDTRRVLYYWHSLGNHLLTTLSNMLTNLNVTDMETCYKMMRTDLAKSLPLTSERFGIEPELIARLSQARARIYEVPISYSGRTYAEGKKIGWRDGFAALWHMLRTNYMTSKAPRYTPPPRRLTPRKNEALRLSR